jgi:hypothetical protein
MANLITLDEYKEAMKITGYGDDVRLESLMTSVSQLVKTYCNNGIRDYYDTNKVETFNIDYSSHMLSLEQSPIVEVVSVQERESLTAAYNTLSETNGEYYVDMETDSILRTDGVSGYKSFAPGPGSVKVTYKGGYSATPADLKLAVIDLVTYYHKDEYKQRQTLAGASIQNQGTSGQTGNVGFPDHIKRVLDLYKNF